MSNFVFIYKITSPTNKIYIGSTVNVINRIRNYKNNYCSRQSKIYNSILKYGWDNHKFEIIEECEIELRNKREYFWGMYYNTLNEGLNCKLPNPDEQVTCISKETSLKMSSWQIGRKMSEEAKSKMREAKLGRVVSEKTKQAVSDSHSIPILQYDLDNNFIKEWKSAAEAAKILELNEGHIRTCCKGKRKTHGKFKWKNKNEQ